MENYIKPIYYSNQLLLNYINDMLDFVQMKNQKIKFAYKSFNLKNMLSNCLKMIDMKAKLKSITLNFCYSPDAPKVISSDENRIRQIVLNLLSNSLKFTKQGEIWVLVEEHNQSVLKVSVKDTGIGVPPEEQDKILNFAFYKRDLGLNSNLNAQGCGFGLPLSHYLAKQLGPKDSGGIKISSKPHELTEFSFLILNQSDEADISDSEGVVSKENIDKVLKQTNFKSIAFSQNQLKSKSGLSIHHPHTS